MLRAQCPQALDFVEAAQPREHGALGTSSEGAAEDGWVRQARFAVQQYANGRLPTRPIDGSEQFWLRFKTSINQTAISHFFQVGL
jgi:hypothetical protein